jgi:biopolymer transport protein ExbD
MGTRSSVNAYIAVALITFGLVLPAAYGHWLTTRTFVALDIPVSLTRGRIRTNDFYVNLREHYRVDVNVDSPFTYNRECPFDGPASVLKTHITLFRDGHLLGETEGGYYFDIASFDAEEKGRYALDIEVLSDASCLNGGYPRLVVETESGFYRYLYEIGCWLSLFPIGGGLGLLAQTLMGVWMRRKKRQKPVIFEPSGPEHHSWPPRFAPAKVISGLPSFGLVCATVLSFVWLALLVYHVNQPSPRGLWVFVAQRPQETNGSVVTSPLVVQLEDAGLDTPPRLYLNSRLVSRREFEGALKEELSRRPDWVVNVEADPELPWQDILDVADTIRGLHAKVVLLTSETKRTPIR